MYFTDSVVHRIFVYVHRFYSLLFGWHMIVAVCLQCSKGTNVLHFYCNSLIISILRVRVLLTA